MRGLTELEGKRARRLALHSSLERLSTSALVAEMKSVMVSCALTCNMQSTRNLFALVCKAWNTFLKTLLSFARREMCLFWCKPHKTATVDKLIAGMESQNTTREDRPRETADEMAWDMPWISTIVVLVVSRELQEWSK